MKTGYNYRGYYAKVCTIFLLLYLSLLLVQTAAQQGSPGKNALSGERYRIIVSSDIGGSDPDDFQSMIHYLLYSDLV